VEKLKREFPFKETLVTIQEQCPKSLSRQGCDDHEELMVTLGAILRNGDTRIRTLTEQLLETGGKGFEAPQRRKDSYSFVSPNSQPNAPPTASGKDISALKEFDDRIGEMPQYKAVSIYQYPPCFEAVLRFRGSEFTGRGGGVKAKGKAGGCIQSMREVCGVDGIMI
jgi:hypothetical protein